MSLFDRLTGPLSVLSKTTLKLSLTRFHNNGVKGEEISRPNITQFSSREKHRKTSNFLALIVQKNQFFFHPVSDEGWGGSSHNVSEEILNILSNENTYKIPFHPLFT